MKENKITILKDGKQVICDVLFTIDGFEIIGYTPEHDIISDTYSQFNGVPRDKFVEEYNKNGVGSENPEKKLLNL